MPTPTIDGHASNKAYVDNEISKISNASDNSNYVKKSGDTMSGPLIVSKDNYPVQGDLNKVISYETQREIFLSKREGGKILQPIDMNGFNINNLPLPTNVDHATNKQYVDTNFLNRLTGGQVGGDIDMRGHSIRYLKFNKANDAAARVAELNTKADRSDLNDYLKIDGSKVMVGSLQMNGNRITGLTQVPYYNGEAVNKRYVDSEIAKIPNIDLSHYLKKDGSDSMAGNLNMDNHMITNVKTPINDNDVANKGYIDNHLIQSAHPQTNILKYIMDDVDQTSSEYGIEIDKIDNYDESFHSYNKKVIYLKLLKDGNNYRARIGYNIFQLIDKSKNKYYTAVIEWLTTDNNVWTKMEVFNNITSGSIISNQTRKFEDGKGLYYTRSIVQFEVMSISSAPLYLLSTIHIDGVNPTYPAKFSEVYNIIYCVNGNHSDILPEVYDKHNAFTIDKNTMIMNADLNMNSHKLLNISNLSNNNLIYIYGLVDQYKIFTSSNVILEFNQIHIDFIRLYTSPKMINKPDILKILHPGENEERYNFQYPLVGLYAHISINRYYNRIETIKLKNASNIGFQIGYRLFY